MLNVVRFYCEHFLHGDSYYVYICFLIGYRPVREEFPLIELLNSKIVKPNGKNNKTGHG